MSDNNGWPDPARPGVPLNPERNGWHWLEYIGPRYSLDYIGPKYGSFYPPALHEWASNGHSGIWVSRGGGGGVHPDHLAERAKNYRYIGPVLTPAEIEKLRAAVQDLAKHIWRGDWDKLKPETRDLLGEKE